MQSGHIPTSPSKPPTGATRRPARRKRAAVPGGGTSSPDFVEALARGLRVLRCFTPGVRSLGNIEIAERTGLARSTVSRLVYTLMTLGYLRYDAETGRYSPGYGVLALGFGCLANLEVRSVARPLMEALAMETGAAVALGVFDGRTMVYIEAVHGSSALYLRLPVGHRVSMNSAMGRSYLASLPSDERAALLPALDLPPDMPGILEKACADYRTSGCCYGIGDWENGINAVAAPFSAITGEGIFVLSCGGPDTLLPETMLRQNIGPRLAEIAGRLSLPQ
jgi:Transcriptional regulator